MTEETIFEAALEKQTPAERLAYLDEACDRDAALRQRVEALIKAHEEAGNFLDRPAIEQIAGDIVHERDRTAAIETPLPTEKISAESPVCPGPGETQAEEPNGDGGQALEFLRRSEKPGSLGRLGHYDVLALVGQGGMGIVLKAFDEVLQRVVAIKVMAPQLATTASARKRFIREAQAAAAIRDEHVIDIHAVDEANGLPYLVMEYVNGISLQERLDQSGPVDLKEILRVGMQTASGLAKAHAQGLIHRDIKPANILLENGVQRVKITDFGLARAVDDASLTQSGVVAGTPQYMAPEQARGEVVDHRADLFSLGSVLYAMCTGRPPFRASTTMAILKRVAEDSPRPVREINPETPDWLAQTIEKLHAKNPVDRFHSAAEVADLLGQHLAHLQRPDSVPLPPTPESARRRASARIPVRHWATAAAALLCLVGGLALTEATGVTRVSEYVATVLRIRIPEGTLVVEVNDPQVKVTIDGYGEEIAITGAGPQEVRLRPGHYQVRASKDGVPVPLDNDLVTITRGGKQVVKVSRESNAAQGKLGVLKTFPQSDKPITQDDVTAEQSGWRIKAKEGRTVRLFEVPDPGVDDCTVIYRARLKTAKVTGRAYLEMWCRFPGQGEFFSKGFHHAVTGTNEWASVETPFFLKKGERPDLIKLNVVIEGQGTVWVKDVELLKNPSPQQAQASPSIKLRTTLRGESDLLRMAFATDGMVLASVHDDGRVILWDVATAQVKMALEGHKLEPRGAAFAPDGKQLATAAGDWRKPNVNGEVKLWDPATGKLLFTLPSSTGPLFSVAFAPNGKTLAAAGRGGTVHLWDPATGTEQALLRSLGGNGYALAYAPDGKTLAVSVRDAVQLWDVTTRQKKGLLQGHLDEVECAAFSSDGKTLATGSRDHTVKLWDAVTLKERATLKGHPGWVTSVAFSPDGKTLASACSHNFAKLWDVASGKALTDVPAPGVPAGSRVAFSPDGKTLATGGNELIRLWEVPEDKRAAHAVDRPPPFPEVPPFVILGRGKADRAFTSLAEAVTAAGSGDTIEVRGNGPFLLPSDGVAVRRALTIQACPGCRPVFQMAATKGGGPRNKFLIEAWGVPLTLEGLDFDRTGSQDEWGIDMAALYVDGAPLRMSNCRLVTRPGTHFLVWLKAVAYADIRNCLFGGETGAAIVASYCATNDQIAISHCIFAGTNNAFVVDKEQVDAASPLRIRLFHNTFASVPLYWHHRILTKRIQVEAEGNIVAGHPVLRVWDTPREIPWAEPVRKLDWVGRQNLYPAGVALVLLHTTPATESASLDAWNRLWKKPEEGSRVGVPKFKGEDAPRGSPPASEAGFWQLMPNSPGKRVGQTGRDLGADVDLVGPAAAYERWKRTTEYQQWLKDTGDAARLPPSAR